MVNDMDQLLVVDDERNMLAAIRRQLDGLEGVEVTTMSDPIEAIAHAGGGRFSVVLVDYAMPKLDGVRFLELVRDVCPAVPGILMSGCGEKMTLVGALNRAHAFHYLDKPFETEELVAVIEAALHEYRSRCGVIVAGPRRAGNPNTGLSVSRKLIKEYGSY